MSEQLTFTYTIDGDDFTRAGEASSSVKNKLKMLGVSSDAIRKVAIAMYEGDDQRIRLRRFGDHGAGGPGTGDP